MSDPLNDTLTWREAKSVQEYFERLKLHLKTNALFGLSPIEIGDLYGVQPEEIASACGRVLV